MPRAAIPARPNHRAARRDVSSSWVRTSDLAFAYATVSVDRLSELRADLDALVRGGQLSDNATFREYLGGLAFDVPEDLSHTRSVIVLAVPSALRRVRFHLDSEALDVMMPPGYSLSGITAEGLRSAVLTEVVGERGSEAVRPTLLQLKPLAVRSGLARYGRNNICYVEGMGSLLTLHAYFTDAELDDGSWGEVAFMEICRDCDLCTHACPCGCFSERSPIVDVGQCVTLYNEIEGDFPAEISADAHNSLMGCMACQLCCPANQEPLGRAERLEDVSEQETHLILEGTPDPELMQSLSRKLKGFPPTQSEELFPLLTRNLRVRAEKREHAAPPSA